jgi:hypothetical protein
MTKNKSIGKIRNKKNSKIRNKKNGKRNSKKNDKKNGKYRNKTKKIYQKGGIDCSGVPNNLPAYLILGHGCNEIDEPEIQIPDNWIYVTSGICGKYIDVGESYDKFSDFFLKNTNETKNVFENPCTNFDKIQEYNDKPTDMQFNITFPSPVPKYQAIRKSYINSKFTLLSDWMYTDQSGKLLETQLMNECTLYNLKRSGIYRAGNTPELTNSLNNLKIINIQKKEDDEIMIPFVYIEYIYLNSIYPTILQIKQRIKKLSLGISGEKDAEGVPVIVPLSVFKSAMKIYDITLSELFEIIKGFDKSGENAEGAVIYNLTCRGPCNKEEELGTQLKTEIRRRKSLAALNTFMDNNNAI